MRTIRIYQPSIFQNTDTIQLDKAASNHLLRVLRLKDQQTFKLFNGDGFEYTALLEVSGKKAIAHILSSIEPANESPLHIDLFQGISKGDHMDMAIQKSVELGIKSITPIICERTVVNLKGDRLEKKIAHWQAIAISACEQSGRCFLPKVHAATSLAKSLRSDADCLQLVLDPLSNTKLHSVQTKTSKLQILIGPEGGLTDNEIELAKADGFVGVNLGPRILRTETATLAAITSAQLLWGDFR